MAYLNVEFVVSDAGLAAAKAQPAANRQAFNVVLFAACTAPQLLAALSQGSILAALPAAERAAIMQLVAAVKQWNPGT